MINNFIGDFKIKPFVKWAGGKRQHLDVLKAMMPRKYNRYIEPFLGGGALFLNLTPKVAIVNDINSELISCFELFKSFDLTHTHTQREREREREREFWNLIKDYESNHSEEFYYKVRDKDFLKLSIEEKVVRFLYLNKAGFNGLYRVNKSGKFNVPFGQKEKISILNKEDIKDLIDYLNKFPITIFNKNYLEVLDMSKKDDFIFVDPPYHGTFTDYSFSSFKEKEQIELFNKLKELDKRGVKWVLCNSSSPFIENLYKDFNIKKIHSKNLISSKIESRLKVVEHFYTNYNFELSEYINSLQETNISLDSIVDWEKVEKKVENLKINLSTLNYLTKFIDKEDFYKKIEKLFIKDKTIFSTLNILLAKRESNKKNKYFDLNTKTTKEFYFETFEDLKNFIEETKLVSLFKQVTNLNDYVFGVEVGLDSNARKNRFGSLMHNSIREILDSSPLVKDIKEEEKRESILNLSNLKEKNKKFDFVFKKNLKTYLIESSFYNGQGSKISETLSSYVNLSKTIKKENFEFIWVVDGEGIKSIQNALEKEWKHLKIMSLKQFKEFILN